MNLNNFSKEPAAHTDLMRIFEMDTPLPVNDSIKEMQKPLDKKWIKKKGKGRNELSYVSGTVVTRLLNKAFQYKWSFEVIVKETTPSIPKPVTLWDEAERKTKNVTITPEGNYAFATNMTRPEDYVTHAQPPVVNVLGRLTIPGFGFKEQWGAHVVVGGASEQESALKSATTDAMKKCASMFGIALELYDTVGQDIEFDTEAERDQHQQELAQHQQQQQMQQAEQEQYAAQQAQIQQQMQQQQQMEQTAIQQAQQQAADQAAQQVAPVAPPVEATRPQVDPTTLTPNVPTGMPSEENAAGVSSLSWADVAPQVDRLKHIKTVLGIEPGNNEALVPYLRTYLGRDDVGIGYITADTITDVVNYLSQIVAAMGPADTNLSA